MRPLNSLRESLDELDEVESHVQNMRQKLDQTIAAQRRLEADAAHELRTPVAGLRVRLELAQQDPDEIDVNELLERALRDVARLQGIVNDLHLLAQLQAADVPAERVPLDLAELVHAEVSQRADRQEIEVRADEGSMVNGIAVKLRRLLAELLDNARRHAKDLVRVQVRRAGDQAELVVADDGSGIPEADRERIFDQFSRLDAARSREQGGSGLGLTIVHNIATAHGGTVQVEGSPLGGASFVVRFPLAA